MIQVDYDFCPPAVRGGLEVPFDVPDWTPFNLIPGGGPAATAYTRRIFGGQYFDVVSKRAAYAEMQFNMACFPGGANGAAMGRLATWSSAPGGPVEWVYSDPVVPIADGAQKNIGTDFTAKLNALMLQTRLHQFMVQVKGRGSFCMARLSVDWRVTHVTP